MKIHNKMRFTSLLLALLLDATTSGGVHLADVAILAKDDLVIAYNDAD